MPNFHVIALVPSWAAGNELNCTRDKGKDPRDALESRLNKVSHSLNFDTAQFIVVETHDPYFADAHLFNVTTTGPHSFYISKGRVNA